VTTTDSRITRNLTLVEAANLLEKLEEGHQAAWLSTRQVPWHSADYQARFQNAAEVDDVFRDLMWETVENGMRRPGEPVEEFAERAESEARLAKARKASAEPPADMISKQAGIIRERLPGSQDELAGRLRNDASTPEGRAYARAFSDTAAARVRELREHDPLPEPDRTPGAPHPDPFLASRGWHVTKHGIYTRAEPEPQARPERELEAGSLQPGSSARPTRDARNPLHPRPASVTATPSRPPRRPPKIHRLIRIDKVRRAWSCEAEKELEP
jgi:hypothetical protein